VTIGALAAVVVASAVFAAATALGGLGAGALGAGDAPILSCDADGFEVSYATSGGNVTDVTIAGIADPACEGGQLSLSLTGSGTALAAGGPQAVPTDGDAADNSMTVPVSPQPAASQVDGIHLVIEGP
jgi:hypothetical protein